MKIIIDAGHGGKDPGAGCGTLNESDITLAVVLAMSHIAANLHPEWEVLLSRSSDTYISPDARRRQCMNEKPDAFVSIHCNAAETAKANGFEVVYRDGEGRALAEAIRKVFIDAFYEMKDRGLKNDLADLNRKLAVLSTPGIPSVIVEMGFITNPKDVAILKSTTELASVLVRGIEQWSESFGG